MGREATGLTIFRYIMILGIFAFMGMLYWSSLLQEENIQAIRTDIAELKAEISDLNAETQEMTEDVMSQIRSLEKSERLVFGKVVVPEQKVVQMDVKSEVDDKTYPNLLKDDRFYSETLPSLLPKGFKPHGIRRSATVGKPDNLTLLLDGRMLVNGRGCARSPSPRWNMESSKPLLQRWLYVSSSALVRMIQTCRNSGCS